MTLTRRRCPGPELPSSARISWLCQKRSWAVGPGAREGGPQMRVAVGGGTGLVGRYVVSTLADSGHQPVVLARSRGLDLTTGTGLDVALLGVAAVIDVSNLTSSKRRESVAFFAAGTEHLLAAGDRAGVRRHVALSIVGIDRVDFGYYEDKRRQRTLSWPRRCPRSYCGPPSSTSSWASSFREAADRLPLCPGCSCSRSLPVARHLGR